MSGGNWVGRNDLKNYYVWLKNPYIPVRVDYGNLKFQYISNHLLCKIK